ncbi:MAG TPA: SprB repeat-containing protein, partial [Ignavibacteria bacterium]
MLIRKSIILFIVSLFWSRYFSYSQSVYVNTPNGIFELNGGAGNCSFIPLTNPCGPEINILNMALFKDTLYYTLSTGELKRFKLGTPGSCELLTQVPGSNSMTVDKNGILYLAGGNRLSKYNPYTNQITLLDTMPCQSSGDLTFYRDKLLLAGRNPNSPVSGIFEININNPPASTNYMNTDNFSFFGLISFPRSCNKSRFFGLASKGSNTEMVELDLENKTVSGVICTLPMEIYDAASNTENGNDDNVLITNLNIYPPCIPMTTGGVEISSFYPSPGDIIYKLDNTVSNTSGSFSDISVGTHTITAIAPSGRCSSDTTFTIPPPAALVKTVDARQSHCNLDNGWIKINLNAYPANAYSSINNGPFTHTLQYSNLSPGNYYVQVKNGPNCYFDTSISIQNINDVKPNIRIQTKDQVCFANNGSIHLDLTGNDSPYFYQLNNGDFISNNEFADLSPATYKINIKNNFDCQWDTFAVIAPYTLSPVSVNIEHTDPTCRGISNGTIKVNINGSQPPYYFLINYHSYNNGQAITGFTEGNYSIEIRNGDQC